MTPVTAMRNRMEPNSGPLQAYAAGAGTAVVQDVPVPRPDEPNVYNLPTGLHPTYRSLSIPIRLGLGVLSTWIAAISTFDKVLWLRPLIAAAKNQLDVRKILGFLLKACVAFLLSSFVLQEVTSYPSRIATKDLIARHFLPSRLSSYDSVTLPDGESLGVHSLQHDSGIGSPKYSALYLNHGFGASSLSWLPVIPKFANRLKIKKTLGHDAVGFGFTDRPENVTLYTPLASSQIGMQLLEQNTEANATSIVLMGHSMGSFATLEMASQLPPKVAVTVILVAPALGLSPRANDRRRASPVADVVQAIVGPPLRYALRRVVGVNGFWKRGLQAVWGDPKLVTDSDALRFQWPSIGKGWEEGLLRFTRAMSGVSDGDLVERVVNRPNTRIVVVVGEKDVVVPRKRIEKVFADFEDVRIVEVEGCGHDPFEEKVDEFIDVVEKALNDQ